MPPVPAVRGVQLVKALEKAGFEVARVRGKSSRPAPRGRPNVAVPVHPGRDVPPGTLRGVLRIIGMTVDELNDPLRLCLEVTRSRCMVRRRRAG